MPRSPMVSGYRLLGLPTVRARSRTLRLGSPFTRVLFFLSPAAYTRSVPVELVSFCGNGHDVLRDQRPHAQRMPDGSPGSRVVPVARAMIVVAILSLCLSAPAWAEVQGTDGSGASTSNVTQGDGNNNIASGANSSAGVVGPNGSSGGSHNTVLGGGQAGNGGFGPINDSGGSYNIVLEGGQAGNGSSISITGSGGSYNQAFGNGSSAGNGSTAAGTSGNIALGSSSTATTLASGGNSVAIGTGAQSTGNNSVALGAGSTDGGLSNVLSVGSSTQTREIINVTAGALNSSSTDAVNGQQLYATNTQQTTDEANISANTVQLNALVNGQAGTCTVVNGGLSCGVNAKATGAGALATGTGATANGAGTVAEGADASAQYAGSVAIGNGAHANADPTTALGDNAVANGNNSTAIGADSTANGAGSVALGYGSVANRANTVSVGNSATGLDRQITNVAPGTQPTDAVNLGQLTQYSATVGAVTSSLAEAAAQGAMNPHPNSVAVATAAYDGQGAMAVSYQHRFGDDWTAGVSVSTDGSAGNTAASVGGSFGW